MTWFLKLENGQPVGHPIAQENMQYLFPDINFNQVVTPDKMANIGYAIYEFTNPPTITEQFKKAVEITPTLSSGIYYQTWQVADMNDVERIQYTNNLGNSIRALRNRLLSDSDWTQLPDANISEAKRESYRQYRQSLRDITSRPGFPFNVYRTATFDEYKTMFENVTSCCQGADYLDYYKKFSNPNATAEDIAQAYTLSKYQALLGTPTEPRVLDVTYPI
jgi:Phage tail assembly chaperone protein